MHQQLSLALFGALILLASCGSRRPVPPAPLPNEVPLTTVDPPPTVSEEEIFIGPEVAPEFSPTRYAPYLQRKVDVAPPLPAPDNNCHLAAEVRNYDGLDGCGLLLETDAGNLFVVGSVPRGDPLEAGTRISFGYEYMTDFANNSCGNTDAVIRITCMRLLRVSSGLPRPVVCEAYEKPSQWLIELARDNSATYITRFPWSGERYVYLLETPNGQFLYDCRGYLICKPRRNCLGFIEDYSQGLLIWEG